MEIIEFETEDIITISGLTGHKGSAGGNEGSGNFSDLF